MFLELLNWFNLGVVFQEDRIAVGGIELVLLYSS